MNVYAGRDSFAFRAEIGFASVEPSAVTVHRTVTYDCSILFSKYAKYAKKQIPKWVSAFLVRRKGLEPLTYWFVASHSIQLS